MSTKSPSPSSDRWPRALKVTSGVLALFFIVSCFIPQAKPIQGDIAESIAKGIAEGKTTFDHTLWDEILQKHAKEGGRKFDYAGLKSEEAKFGQYLEKLANVDLSTLPGNELLALFANAYNAYIVKTILENVAEDGSYQIKSIRDISKVFDLKNRKVGGYTLSLNNIEHNILRPTFKDPRIHFAVNCASTSCPPIPVRAFISDQMDEQLDLVTRNTLSSPDYVRVEDDQLLVTRIMDWYGEDFVSEGYKGAEKDLPSFIRKYTREEVSKWIESQSPTASVKFMGYDWSLNKP